MIALLMVDVTSSPVGRERRSDDAGPLVLVVEKLTQQVNSLNTQLIEQANSFTAQLDSVNAEVTALKAKTGKLFDCLSVLFSAVLPEIVCVCVCVFVCVCV